MSDAIQQAERPLAQRPRLGFLGIGWIGRNRMEAIVGSGAAHAAAMCDPVADVASAVTFDAMLDMDLDGVVIATPSALHAEQAIAALERGLAVFCQKPLGRNELETRRVIEAARAANRLLGVDLSYRHTAAAERMREVVRSGELGRIYAADLVFHNAYGPDKGWFYDRALSGGGCVIDLGIHLVDLLFWLLDDWRAGDVTSRLYEHGLRLPRETQSVEDYAAATIDLECGATARLACSWKLPAGQDAVIEATLYGTGGSVSMRNVNGSFYDFAVDRMTGTRRERLVDPPDAWGGRAAVAWAKQLALSCDYDERVEQTAVVAAVLDRIYEQR